MNKCWNCVHHSVTNPSLWSLEPVRHYCSHPEHYCLYAYNYLTPETKACPLYVERGKLKGA